MENKQKTFLKFLQTCLLRILLSDVAGWLFRIDDLNKGRLKDSGVSYWTIKGDKEECQGMGKKRHLEYLRQKEP